MLAMQFRRKPEGHTILQYNLLFDEVEWTQGRVVQFVRVDVLRQEHLDESWYLFSLFACLLQKLLFGECLVGRGTRKSLQLDLLVHLRHGSKVIELLLCQKYSSESHLVFASGIAIENGSKCASKWT